MRNSGWSPYYRLLTSLTFFGVGAYPSTVRLFFMRFSVEDGNHFPQIT